MAEVLRALTSSINNGPDFLDIVRSSGGIRPEMAIGRDISAVVKVVEYPELQREFVFVRSNFSTVHGQRRVAVAHSQVAEHLIVSPIFFDNIDHVQDSILASL